MNLKVEQKDELTVVYLEGRFDAYSAPDVNSQMESLSEKQETPQLIVNLSLIHI